MRTFLWCAAALFGMTMVAAASRTGGVCVSVILILAVPALMIGYILHADRQKQAREQKARAADVKRREDQRQADIRVAEEKVRLLHEQRASMIKDTRERYRLALDRLEADPGSLEHRKSALAAGREQADVVRIFSGGRGRTVFDESEIQNDIAIRIGNSQAVATPKRSHKCLNCAAPLVHEAKVCRFCDAPVHA